MKEKASTNAPSQRQQKVAEEIRHILSTILLRGDYSKRGLVINPVTLSQIKISPDLKYAKVYTIPLGGKEDPQTLKNLNEMSGEIRYSLAKVLQTKYTPILKFFDDDTFDQARQIDKLLNVARQRDLEIQQASLQNN